MPQLRCGCGTPINLFMGLKGLTEMDEMMEAAHKELEANNLEKAQEMYTSNLLKLDKVLAKRNILKRSESFKIRTEGVGAPLP